MAIRSVLNPNQITSVLADMSNDQLKQYALRHKNDIYTFSLASAESDRRKRAEITRLGQAGQQQLPKVNDQIIAGMSQGLPEDSGIAQLPTGSMQYADGGIVAFAEAGQVTDPLAQYEEQIRSEAERQGVDPDMAVRMFRQESGGNKNAVSPKGASGLGQLMLPAAQEMGLSDKERFDPNKNIPASIGYFKKQQDRFGDPEIAAAAYNYGPGATARHLAQNNGQLNRVGLPKETADYLTKLFPAGSAQAQQVTPVSSQQNQPSIYSGPTPTEAGLEALGQRLDIIRSARSSARPPNLRERREDPESINRYQALQDLNNASQKEYKQYAASLGLDEPALFAVRKNTDTQPSFTTNPTVQKIAKEAAVSNAPPKSAPAASEAKPYAPFEENFTPQDLTKKEQNEVVAVAKEAMPEKKSKSFSGEDWLMLGLGLLGGESPYAWRNLGNAGKQVIANRIENRKADLEAAKNKADIEYKNEQTASSKLLTPAQVEYYKSKATDAIISRDEAKALAIGTKQFEIFSKMPANSGLSPEVLERQREMYIAKARSGFASLADTSANPAVAQNTVDFAKLK